MFERKLHAEHLGDPTSRCWVPASKGGGSGGFGREWALARPGAGGIAGNGLDRFEVSEEHNHNYGKLVLITIVKGVYKPTYYWGGPHCNHLDYFENIFYKLGLGMGISKQMLYK